MAGLAKSLEKDYDDTDRYLIPIIPAIGNDEVQGGRPMEHLLRPSFLCTISPLPGLEGFKCFGF